jgi:hypothetical protein
LLFYAFILFFSLGATSKRFVALMTAAQDQTIELNQAARKLQAPKRRIYDVTNVLEGKYKFS